MEYKIDSQDFRDGVLYGFFSASMNGFRVAYAEYRNKALIDFSFSGRLRKGNEKKFKKWCQQQQIAKSAALMEDKTEVRKWCTSSDSWFSWESIVDWYENYSEEKTRRQQTKY